MRGVRTTQGDETRFQFLVAVGKEADVMSSSVAARLVLPPTLLKQARWSDAIDERVWVHYTSSEQERGYDTASTTHLLRFLRNCEAHPPPPGSPAQAVLVAYGGMASYFCSCFPHLALAVRTALAADEGWRNRSGLSKYMVASTASSVTSFDDTDTTDSKAAASGAGAGASAAKGSVAAKGSIAAKQPIENWLVSVNPVLGRYAAAFTDYGYDDTSLLVEATQQDIEDAMEELEMKKGHRRALLNAFEAFQS
jgi:hypothetical protein